MKESDSKFNSIHVQLRKVLASTNSESSLQLANQLLSFKVPEKSNKDCIKTFTAITCHISSLDANQTSLTCLIDFIKSLLSYLSPLWDYADTLSIHDCVASLLQNVIKPCQKLSIDKPEDTINLLILIINFSLIDQFMYERKTVSVSHNSTKHKLLTYCCESAIHLLLQDHIIQLSRTNPIFAKQVLSLRERILPLLASYSISPQRILDMVRRQLLVYYILTNYGLTMI